MAQSGIEVGGIGNTDGNVGGSAGIPGAGVNKGPGRKGKKNKGPRVGGQRDKSNIGANKGPGITGGKKKKKKKNKGGQGGAPTGIDETGFDPRDPRHPDNNETLPPAPDGGIAPPVPEEDTGITPEESSGVFDQGVIDALLPNLGAEGEAGDFERQLLESLQAGFFGDNELGDVLGDLDLEGLLGGAPGAVDARSFLTPELAQVAGLGSVADQAQGGSIREFDRAANRLRERIDKSSQVAQQQFQNQRAGQGFQGVTQAGLGNIQAAGLGAFGQGLTDLQRDFEASRLQGLGIASGALGAAGQLDLDRRGQIGDFSQGLNDFNRGIFDTQVEAGLGLGQLRVDQQGNQAGQQEQAINQLLEFLGLGVQSDIGQAGALAGVANSFDIE